MIRVGREIQCLPYAGFFLLFKGEQQIQGTLCVDILM